MAAIAKDIAIVRLVDTPAIMRGATITIDSGMFWSEREEATVRMLPIFSDEKLTPEARPSGILWSAIAAVKRSAFEWSLAESDEPSPAMR